MSALRAEDWKGCGLVLCALLAVGALARAYQLGWSDVKTPFLILVAFGVFLGLAVGMPALKKHIARARERKARKKWRNRKS